MIAPKFKFGYYDEEDIVQEAIIIGLKALESYDTNRPLENYLFRCMHNGLFNLKRQKYFRPNPPCSQCPIGAIKYEDHCSAYQNLHDCEWYSRWLKRTETRRHLMSTYDNANEAAEADDILEKSELYEIIDKNMPVSMRESWIRFTHGFRLPSAKKERLLLVIYEILEEHNIEI